MRDLRGLYRTLGVNVIKPNDYEKGRLVLEGSKKAIEEITKIREARRHPNGE